MPNATRRVKARTLPDDEPRFRIAHLLCDPALRTALGTVESELGPIPVLPENKIGAAGSDSAESVFSRAYREARIAEARYELVEAEFCAVLGTVRGKELDDFQAARIFAREQLNQALVRLAGLPAMIHRHLEYKKKIFGKIRLRKNGVFRDAVAADEAYLKTKARALKEARQ